LAQVAPTRRAWSKSIFARPHICRLMNLSLVIRPSVWPFDHGEMMGVADGVDILFDAAVASP
jgi:hypothetical protein